LLDKGRTVSLTSPLTAVCVALCIEVNARELRFADEDRVLHQAAGVPSSCLRSRAVDANRNAHL
jgi:hypothetical protein